MTNVQTTADRIRHFFIVALIGLISGTLVGFVAFIFSGYEQSLPQDLNPVLREEAASRMFWLFLIGSVVTCTLLALVFGRRQVGRRIQAVTYGMLAAVALVTIPTSTLAPDYKSFAAPTPREYARLFLPVAALVGAIAGFVYAERTEPKSNVSLDSSPRP